MTKKSQVIVKMILIVITSVILLDLIPMSFAKLNEMPESTEWWIQMEIFSTDNNQEYNDNILVDLYDNVIQLERDYILSWHFFREPSLRFRLELINEESRDRIAVDLYNYLGSVPYIDTYYFANHSQKVDNLDEGYQGEYKNYQRMWPYQKKIWEWGSEMTVEAIKESQATGENSPSREYQLTRTFHLLCNQLSPGFEIRYCNSTDDNGEEPEGCRNVAIFVLGILFTIPFYYLIAHFRDH